MEHCLDESVPELDESTYRGMLALAPDPALLATPEGRVILANREAQVLFADLESAPLCGNLFTDYIAGPGNDSLEALVNSLDSRGPTCTGEFRLARGGETECWVALSCRKVPGFSRHPTLVLIHARDITERRNTEARLQGQLLLDELTGLMNRRGFDIVAGQEIRHAHRAGKGMGLLFFDMDGLKAINDTFGHLEGDAALREAADILRYSFRDSDVMSRWGGDEFAVLALDIPEGCIPILLRRLEERLERRNADPAARYPLSLSSGMARYDPAAPMRLVDLIRQADAGMYDEKRRRGRR